MSTERHPNDPSVLRFEQFEIDPANAVLRANGTAVRLRPQAFNILVLLVRNAGQLVTREQIRREIWGDDTFVDFNQGLNACIRQIREALGDTPNPPRYVETVPRLGYRFIAPVHVHGMPLPDAASQLDAGTTAAVLSSGNETGDPLSRRRRTLVSAATALLVLGAAGVLAWTAATTGRTVRSESRTAQIDAIAVLPFANVAPDEELTYFADGMTDALINDLARVPSLRVISRTSTMRYRGTDTPLPEIARRLNVDAVVEGAVLYAGGRVRVTAQLIDAATDEPLWASSYERDVTDAVRLQRELAAAIVGEIRAEVGGAHGPADAPAGEISGAAYEAYLKGQYFLAKRTADSFRTSITYFDRAIAAAPTYAPAYAGLSDAYALLGSPGNATPLRPRDAMPRAKAAALRALALDPGLSNAHTSLGYVLAHYERDWAGAEGAFQRAISLTPNSSPAHHWYALLLAALGRADEAMGAITRAQELDPLSLIVQANKGRLLLFARDYDRAVAEYRKALDLDPGFIRALNGLSTIYGLRGMHEEAVELRRQALMLTGREHLVARLRDAVATAGSRALLQHELDQSVARAKTAYVPAVNFALLHAGLGHADAAFEWLGRALEDRDALLIYVGVDPRLDPIRSDRRFPELLRRVGLPDTAARLTAG